MAQFEKENSSGKEYIFSSNKQPQKRGMKASISNTLKHQLEGKKRVK
ncbi:MAG: hypothetical protein PHI48_06305 [Bacteroidales bacterium]|nr:hypothetical protein [Bacteroidales bacterium]